MNERNTGTDARRAGLIAPLLLASCPPVIRHWPRGCPAQRTSHSLTAQFTIIVTLLVGCADSTEPSEHKTGPTVEEVSGAYEATTFTTQEGSIVTDQLLRGSSLALNLSSSLTTTGRLFVPRGAEDGSDFTADLAGSWQLRSDTVLFLHPADTFIRDMVFVFAEQRLSGQESFGNTTVKVVLSRH